MKIYSMFAVLLMSLGLQVFALPAVQVGSKETGITSTLPLQKSIYPVLTALISQP